MATNAQKTPFGLSLNRFARSKALEAISQTGRSLPCQVVAVRGAIVTVNFQVTAAPGAAAVTIPNVTIPVIGTEYARPPIQVGCKGVALAADAYLGGMSGLGGGVATLTAPGNLTALVFAPIGNTGWSTVDANAYTIYGPNGVVMRDSGSASAVTLTPSQINTTTPGLWQVIANGHTLAVQSGGLYFDGVKVNVP